MTLHVVVHTVHHSIARTVVLQDSSILRQATALQEQPELLQVEQLLG
jgi:hypothetical protein